VEADLVRVFMPDGNVLRASSLSTGRKKEKPAKARQASSIGRENAIRSHMVMNAAAERWPRIVRSEVSERM